MWYKSTTVCYSLVLKHVEGWFAKWERTAAKPCIIFTQAGAEWRASQCHRKNQPWYKYTQEARNKKHDDRWNRCKLIPFNKVFEKNAPKVPKLLKCISSPWTYFQFIQSPNISIQCWSAYLASTWNLIFPTHTIIVEPHAPTLKQLKENYMRTHVIP